MTHRGALKMGVRVPFRQDIKGEGVGEEDTKVKVDKAVVVLQRDPKSGPSTRRH